MNIYNLENLSFVSSKDTLISSLIKIISNYDFNLYNLINDYIKHIGININKNLIDKCLEYNIMNNIANIVDKKYRNNEIIENKIEKYENNGILAKLGDGGFSKVYKYYNNLDRNYYALKKVEIKSHNKLDNYLREVQIMSKLNHKNIVKYNFSWLDLDHSTLNIQMELCDFTLHEYLQKRKNYSPDNIKNAYYISKEILDGLEYLHNIDIIHGDISTHNIFICHSNQNFEIKIGDFGLSRLHNNELIDKSIKLSDEYGNPVYRAPELSNFLLFKASDVYSYGIILFEVFNIFKTQHQRIDLIKKLKQKTIQLEKDIHSSLIYDKLLPEFIKLLYALTNYDILKRPNLQYIKYYLCYFAFNQI